VIAPLAIVALATVGLAARDRRRLPLALAAGACAWLAIVGVMTALGYAGLPRFALPAAALICVLGGAGIAELVRMAGPRLAVLAAAAVVLVCLPFAIDRVDQMANTAREASSRDRLQDQLFAAVDRLGGARRVLSCGRPAVESPFFTAFAWRLGVPARAIDRLHHPRIVFRTRHLFVAGFGGPQRVRRLTPRRPARMVVRVGEWEVLVSARSTRCAPLRAG